MVMNKQKEKEKEREEKLKELRRELEDKIEEQLPEELLGEKIPVEIEQIDTREQIEPETAKKIIEALIFASSRPLTVNELRKVIKCFKPGEIQKFVVELKEEYDQNNRSFEIREVAGGYEIVTRKDYAPWLHKLEVQKKRKHATASALETLAILAYKQPITRAEIEALRGVDVSGVLNTLVERNLIKIVGKKDVPGRPFMYGTTEKFLEHFGLKDLTGLPNIEEIRSLVENSVKKDDLFQNPKIVPMTEGEAEEPSGEPSADQGEPQAEETASAEAPLTETATTDEVKTEERDESERTA